MATLIDRAEQSLAQESQERPRLPVWLAPAIALAALLSMYSIFTRFQVEARNRAVALAAEFETIEALASAQGITAREALLELKEKGLRSVVLSEETIGDLIDQGRATMSTSVVEEGGGILSLPVLNFPSDTTSVGRVDQGLRIRFGELYRGVSGRQATKVMLPPVSGWLIRSTPVGLSRTQAQAVREAGLGIIARHSNPTGISAEGIRQTLAWSKSLGASIFLPQGDQVLGRRDSIEDTIDALHANRMYYATPEFAKIGGDAVVVGKAPGIVIRLHAAQGAELDKLTLPEAVERYSKAARERNIRILLLRPVSNGADEPLSVFGDFVGKVAQRVREEGNFLASPHPYSAPDLPKWFFVLLGLAITPVGYFVGSSVLQSKNVRLAGGAMLLLLALACYVKPGQQIMALAAAILFPIAGFLVLDWFADRSRRPNPGNLLWAFAIVSVITLVGGLCVAGMLNGLPYYIKAAEFQGIKLAVFLPIVGVGGYYLWRLVDWREAFASPITWGASALAVVLAGALAFMMARTGNDSGVGASGLEVQFRNLLDAVLYVRPRTKEFLIGHPLLVVGTGMLLWLRTRREGGTRFQSQFAAWTVLALMLGAVGQTSVVNTLCHLHIPITLSLARIGEGLVIGCIIGLVIWAIGQRRLPGEEV